MPTRYFKATDGERTYFRSSQTKVYRSVVNGRDGIGFSQTVATGVGVKEWPAVEIDKAEYKALKALQRDRMGNGMQYASPRNSWVMNEQIDKTA